jgi:hypothetical protein
MLEVADWVAVTPANTAISGIVIDVRGGPDRFSDSVRARDLAGVGSFVECPACPATLVTCVVILLDLIERVVNRDESGTSSPENRICRMGALFWS